MNLDKFENAIVNARMSGLAVAETSPKELNILADVTIFKISAISGFSLPASDKFADVLNQEFLLLLLDYGFDKLTFEEIITAFRFNARGGYRLSSGDFVQQVTPYSTYFSINYAAKVLENYISFRNRLDYKIINFIQGSPDIYEKYKK